MSVITVENLRYRYPHTEKLALDGITFSVEKGEFIGIIGENGAGKSTLSQALTGLVPQFYKGAYGGSVAVDGQRADQVPVAEMCRKAGLVFQNPFNQLSGAKDTVYEEVAFGMQNLGVERVEMKKRVEETLKLLDIWQFKDRNPFDLSGGQMQRVAIAGILVMRPDVIILDEPTSQLDPKGAEEVFQAVGKLTEAGITILMIEQKIEKMAAWCDRVLLLHDGKQIAFDTPGRIFSLENLESFGVQPPAYTRICRGLGIRLAGGDLPVTEEEAVSELKGRKPTRCDGAVGEKAGLKAGAFEARGESGGPAGAKDCAEEVFLTDRLDFHYLKGVPVLAQLCLGLDRRPTAIIGQNGAGKTTLVKLLKGLLKAVSGTVYYRGEDISGKTVAMLAGNIGYVFQNPDDQIFKYNVLEEVMFGPLNIGMSREKAKEEAKKALKLCHLADREEENPYDLELYERKMVAVASVLAMDTDVLILDEPTIAQDCVGKAVIGKLIGALTAQGKLVISILHDMDFVAEYFERVIVMAHGKVLADGAAREVFSQEGALREACLQKPYVMQLCERLGYDESFLTVEEFFKSNPVAAHGMNGKQSSAGSGGNKA